MLVELNHRYVPDQGTKGKLTEEEVEDLLSERLLEGYQLIEKSCPECTTPLIKIENSPQEVDGNLLKTSVLIPNRNPEKPFDPVDGVPVCVACNCHVVTQECEMNILERHETTSGSIAEKPDPSPKSNDAPVIDLTAVASNDSFDVGEVEYSIRREVATKVLGSKLLQGYVLKQEQCDKCGMPQMEYQGELECVVCPVLAKKAKKTNKKKSNKKTTAYEHGMVREQNLLHRQERKREEQELHDEKLFKKQIQVQTVIEEEPELAPKREIRDDVISVRSSHAPSTRDIMVQREHQDELEEEYRAHQAKRREEEMLLMEETKRLALLEEEYSVRSIRTTDIMQRDLLMEQHRNRLASKARLDEDILKLEQMRLIEEMEHRRMAEEQRAEEEADVMTQLEKEAEAKAKEAEEALERAKAARDQVAATRKSIIAQTIAMAEAEVIAETEGFLKQEIEEYKSPVLLPTASEVESEQWETLRTEGRTVMTRRVMSGWTIIAEFCRGAECEHSPLIMKRNQKECVVCGGCGDGTDGAYAKSGSMDSEDDDEQPEDSVAQTYVTSTQTLASNPALQHLQSDFETKRDMVSREIGKKMAEGWTLLDGTCQTCVMPMMTDAEGTRDVCVLCDLIGHHMQNSEALSVASPSRRIPTIRPSTPTSRYSADPPATVTTSTDESDGEMTISIPKNFDIRNQEALMSLINKAKGRNYRVTEEPKRRGNSYNDDIIDLSTYPSLDEQEESSEMIAMMFMESPIGAEAKSMGSRIDINELIDLVEIYISTNFGESLEGRVKEIAHVVWRKMHQTSNVAEVPKRRTPKNGMPPKPESRSGTPRKSRTPSEHDSPAFFADDDYSMSDKSAAANMKLEDILSKIEQCKQTLYDDDMSVGEQMQAANLIEKLSKAALAVQGIDDCDS
eukprot:scaffold22696_cov118-Cylindrotheca_fusiformis.AAC.11